MSRRKLDLTNKKFNKLTAIKPVGKNKTKNIIWRCKCDCGNYIEALVRNLRSGRVKSCGCIRKETSKITAKKNLKEEANANLIYGQYKESAKRRGLFFDLSFDVFYDLIQQNCHYCGVEPTTLHWYYKNTKQFYYNGIDRIDPTKGYILDNCVSCCKNCNYMKRCLSQDDFYQHIIKIYNHSILKGGY